MKRVANAEQETVHIVRLRTSEDLQMGIYLEA